MCHTNNYRFLLLFITNFVMPTRPLHLSNKPEPCSRSLWLAVQTQALGPAHSGIRHHEPRHGNVPREHPCNWKMAWVKKRLQIYRLQANWLTPMSPLSPPRRRTQASCTNRNKCAKIRDFRTCVLVSEFVQPPRSDPIWNRGGQKSIIFEPVDQFLQNWPHSKEHKFLHYPSSPKGISWPCPQKGEGAKGSLPPAESTRKVIDRFPIFKRLFRVLHMNYQNNVRNYYSRASMTLEVKSNPKVCLFRIAGMSEQNKH